MSEGDWLLAKVLWYIFMGIFGLCAFGMFFDGASGAPLMLFFIIIGIKCCFKRWLRNVERNEKEEELHPTGDAGLYQKIYSLAPDKFVKDRLNSVYRNEDEVKGIKAEAKKRGIII